MSVSLALLIHEITEYNIYFIFIFLFNYFALCLHVFFFKLAQPGLDQDPMLQVKTKNQIYDYTVSVSSMPCILKKIT